MYFTYDPNENIFIIEDEDTRLREGTSHLGAHMFNVYSYGRASIKSDDQIGGYFTNIGGDVRLENQGMFVVEAASTYAPPFGTEDQQVTLGNLVLHYEIELQERGLDEDLSRTLYASPSVSTTITTVFTNITVTGLNLKVNKSWISSVIGSSFEQWNLAILIPINSLYNDTQNDYINVITRDTSDAGVSLFNRGSVWYLASWDDDTDYLDIYSNFGDALENRPGCQVTSAQVGTDTITGHFNIWVYDMRLFS
jgi:hypothetical protein